MTRHRLRHGDIVVFATDGVWDNLSSQDVLGIVGRIMTEKGYWFEEEEEEDGGGGETLLNAELISALPRTVSETDGESYLPGLLATAIMREAKVAGLDRRREGPFAKEVQARYPNEGWEGGKPDDIAVVVCVAVEEKGQDGEKSGEEDEKPIKAKL